MLPVVRVDRVLWTSAQGRRPPVIEDDRAAPQEMKCAADNIIQSQQHNVHHIFTPILPSGRISYYDYAVYRCWPPSSTTSALTPSFICSRRLCGYTCSSSSHGVVKSRLMLLCFSAAALQPRIQLSAGTSLPASAASSLTACRPKCKLRAAIRIFSSN